MDAATHKQKSLTGLRWSLIDQVLNQVFTLLTALILMRLIGPEQFGLIRMVTVFSNFLNVFKDFGLGSSLIQKKSINKVDRDTIFWVSVVIGVFLTILLVALSPLISSFYNENALTQLALVISPIFVIQTLSSTHQAIAKKELNFKSLFFANFSGIISGVVVALLLAFNGYGVWALVFQQLTNSLIRSLILWITIDYKPGFDFSKSVLKSHFNFSFPLVGQKSVDYWGRNADNFFIGRFLGSEALGIYSRAYGVMLIPVNRISRVLSNVLFPSLSLIQDDNKKLTEIFLKSTRLMAFITLPLMAMLFIGAEGLVLGLLGHEWKDLIFILRIFSFVGAFQAIGSLKHNVFLAKGRTLLQFKFSLVKNIILVVLFFILSQFNKEYVALGYLAFVFTFQFIGIYLISRVLNIKVSMYYFNIGFQFFYYLLISICGLLLINYLNTGVYSEIIFSIVFSTISWLLIYFLKNSLWSEFKIKITEILQRSL